MNSGFNDLDKKSFKLDNELHKNNAYFINLCRKSKYLDTIKLYIDLNYIDVTFNHNKALDNACSNGNINIVKELLKNEKVIVESLISCFTTPIRKKFNTVLCELLSYRRIVDKIDIIEILKICSKYSNKYMMRYILKDETLYCKLTHKDKNTIIQNLIYDHKKFTQENDIKKIITCKK